MYSLLKIYKHEVLELLNAIRPLFFYSTYVISYEIRVDQENFVYEKHSDQEKF